MERRKILVVDDESRMRKLVRDFLVKNNYDVLEAEDGEQAVELFFREKGIALIVLDVMMPKMDGWQVCREIRAYSQVPIIMLTARGDERDELQGFQLGVDEYISKPFSPKILVARIEAILRRTLSDAQEQRLSCGGITIDKTAHQVTIDLIFCRQFNTFFLGYVVIMFNRNSRSKSGIANSGPPVSQQDSLISSYPNYSKYSGLRQ